MLDQPSPPTGSDETLLNLLHIDFQAVRMRDVFILLVYGQRMRFTGK